jgi:hypothetical protein
MLSQNQINWLPTDQATKSIKRAIIASTTLLAGVFHHENSEMIAALPIKTLVSFFNGISERMQSLLAASTLS